MGRDKKWAFPVFLSGVVAAMAALTAATRSNDENSLFVLLLCPSADVSNLHCGFIRLFPKRTVTLVEGFSSESFFWEGFMVATDTSYRMVLNLVNPALFELSNLDTSRADPNGVTLHSRTRTSAKLVSTTMEFRAFVAKAPHLTIPRQRTLVYRGKFIFSNAAAKLPKAISQKRHDGFSFLNDGNLDKCLSKKKIRLTTPALWLSSPH